MNNPTILVETDGYLVINKPAGWAVEPVAGKERSILDFLVEQGRVKKEDWSAEQRYGVVHRLDVDTSGILIWAKTPVAQAELKLSWQSRQVDKTYLGLVVGETERQGTIELPIMRDNQKDRQIVALLPNPKARPAITNYKLLATAKVGDSLVSFIEAKPITGRTHQIRVHMQYLGHPIIGDKRYGNKASNKVAKILNLNRHFLHAARLKLPGEERAYTKQDVLGKSPTGDYQAPLPEELQAVLARINVRVKIT